MPKKITQSRIFPVPPERVYEAYLSTKEHSAFTGAEARMSAKEGGRFSAWDGYISGKNLELKKDRRIVQEWTCADFPDGHLSRITFILSPAKKGCKLEFTHENVPDENYADIKQGWIDNYWEPMSRYFADKGV